jgi:glycolate oxidase iron-sulfur subunit
VTPPLASRDDVAVAEPDHAFPRPLGAFDGEEPPDWEGILDCMHCGICLPQCPSYRVLGQEMDSPRGRVYLMRAATEGRIGLTENFVLHMDRCLGCRACETACPAGVPFGRLIEETRGQIERRVRRPLGRRLLERVLLGVFPERERLARALALTRLYQRSGLQRVARGSGLLRAFPRLAAMERLLPALPARPAERLPRETLPASGPPRGTVALLEGCVQALLFPEVNRATVSLLARAGYRVVVPPGQGCCGALHLHSGDRAGGRALGRRNVAALSDADWIVTNAAGCGAAMRDYGHLLGDDPRAGALAGRVRDVTELLAESLPGPRRPLDLTVTYHEPCHLAHGQRVREAPRAVLRAIPGLRFAELTESDLCCGSAGVYNLMEPEIAGRLLGRKLDRIAATGAEIVATGNPGCLLQLRQGLADRGLAVRAHHPVEILAWSVEGTPPVGMG